MSIARVPTTFDVSGREIKGELRSPTTISGATLPQPASSSTSSSSTSSSSSSTDPASLAGPSQALPTTISLALLASTNPEMNIPGARPATLEEIQAAATQGPAGYFALQKLFKATVVAENNSGSVNYPLRDAFMVAFTRMQLALTPLRKQAKPDGLSEEQWIELKEFISSGCGAESVRLFGKILISVRQGDSDYLSKMMQLAKDNWHMEKYDVIPGSAYRLAERSSKEKVDIPLDQSIFLDERRALQEHLKKAPLQAMMKLSATLPGNIFYRGVVGSGKSALAKERHGLIESEFVTSNSIKMDLFKSNLAHHESCGMMDDLRRQVPNKIDMRINSHKRDTVTFTSQEGPKIMHDIHVSEETAKRRVAAQVPQGGRLASDDEIATTCKDSAKNRPGIIQHAFENPLAQWHFYDNNTDGALCVPVAQIVKGELTIQDQARFNERMEKDDDFRKVMTPHLPPQPQLQPQLQPASAQ